MSGPKIPAKHLFRLLAFVGVTQKEVRLRLKTSKALVSFWATGTRPMPESYLSAILDLMDAALAQRPPRDPDSEELFTHQVMAMLEACAVEQGEHRFIAEIAEACRALARDGSDPEKLKALLHSPDGNRVRQTFESGLRNLKRLDRIYSPFPVEIIRRRLRRHGLVSSGTA